MEGGHRRGTPEFGDSEEDFNGILNLVCKPVDSDEIHEDMFRWIEFLNFFKAVEDWRELLELRVLG